jgi:hypothetical protein
MKRVLIIFILATTASCNTRQQDTLKHETDSTTNRLDSVSSSSDKHYMWEPDWEGKKGLVMKKTEPLTDDSLTTAILIRRINELYPEITVIFKKVSNDTIFISLKNSRYLTQQMGSTGAQGYLAAVTYNLTEVKNLNFVDVSFKPGDHAMPGTYTRLDFVRKAQ